MNLQFTINTFENITLAGNGFSRFKMLKIFEVLRNCFRIESSKAEKLEENLAKIEKKDDFDYRILAFSTVIGADGVKIRRKATTNL